MKNIDELAIKATNDSDLLSDFIKSQKYFIIKCAFKATKKFISKNDDEWSIAQIAFCDAVKTYSKDKGNFLNYAETVIKNRLIDYFRSEQKKKIEYSVNPNVFESDSDEDDDELTVRIAVSKKIAVNEDNPIKYEIEAITEIFKEYGFSFYDLTYCSPKSFKTKASCKQAVLFILENKAIFDEIKTTKQLPIKIIQENTFLPRKLIERHRKYIIAAAEILSGEYPYLAEYLSFIRKDGR